MDEMFDVIVVGGGLAGLAAAYTMAEEGLEVLLLEKGEYSGAKNVTGGRLYLSPIRDLYPEIWSKLPLERHIAHEEVSIMDKNAAITVRYEGDELKTEPYQSYSVLRGKFDRAFAKLVERKGVAMVTKTRVDDLIIENGKVCGVVAGGDELRAHIVLACDGVLSFTAQKAGLRKALDSHNYAVGFKEVIELPREIIEDRFNLTGDEGTARLFMGEVTAGKFGGGFLYTNKESLSLGIVVGIHALADEEPGVAAPELLDTFKQRPEIAALIRGGQTVEYSAHVVPEGGYKALNKLYGDGILVAGDAAGFSMNIGVTVRGMEYAIASGYYAAKTAISARQHNDSSASFLASYEKMLDDSFVMQDFKNFKDSIEVLDHPRLFQHYPAFATQVMKEMYAVPAGAPKEKLFSTVKKHLSFSELIAMAKDARRMMKI